MSTGAINCLNFYIFMRQSLSLGWVVLARMWSIIDLLSIVFNFVLVFSDLVYQIQTKDLRIIEAFLSILMWFKSLYYLSLIGEIAPLVDIIFVIMNDIKYFTIIFAISLMAFINAFYVLGKNQMEDAGGDDNLVPQYSTWLGSAQHVYLSALGEFDTEFYFNSDMTPWLIILFLGMSFFMCIHLLNMLIAIMGESFSHNNEIKESKKRMQQLAFVVDNWWIDPIRNKDKIVFLVLSLGGE